MANPEIASNATIPQSNTPTVVAPLDANKIATIKNNWNKISSKQQQAIKTKYTGFDPSKYGLTYKPTSTAPVDNIPPTPTSTTPPTPTPSTAQQPSPTDNADTGSARLLQIQTNLDNYYKTQPALFTDRTAFDTYFKYKDRAGEQKTVLDNFYNQKVNERNIINKGAVKIAKDGDNVDFLKMSDPQLYNQVQQEKQKLITQQDNTNTLLTYAKQFGFTDIDKDGVLDQFQKQTPVPDLNDTPEIAATKTKQVSVAQQIADLDLQIDKIRKDVITQYPGVPDSQISSIVTDRTNKLIDQRNSLANESNANNATIKNFQDQQALTQKEYELTQSDLQNKISNFNTMYGIYQSTPEGLAEAAIAKYKIENPNMDTGTPQEQEMAVNKVLTDYYSQYKDIIKRPQAQVLSDVLAYAKANGVTVSQALKDNFITPLQSKSEYKTMLDKSMGIGVDWTKLSDTMVFNAKTGEFKTIGGVGSSYSGPSFTPATQTQVQSTLATYTAKVDGTTGGECGTFVNDYLQSMGVGRIFTDPIDAKKAAKNSDTPTVGSVAIFDYTNNPNATDAQKLYGHVAIVTKVNADGTVNLKESNQNGDKAVFSRMNVPTSKIAGYFDPTKAGASSGSAGYNPALGGFFDKYTNVKGSTMTAADWKTLAELGVNKEDFINQATAYKAAGPTAAGKNDKLLSLITTAKKLKKEGGRFMTNITLGYGLPGTQSRTFAIDFTNLKKNLTLQVFKDAKAAGVTFGAMSEGEWKLLDEASSKMNIGLPEADYQVIMDEIIATLTKGLGGVAEETVSTSIVTDNPRD